MIPNTPSSRPLDSSLLGNKRPVQRAAPNGRNLVVTVLGGPYKDPITGDFAYAESGIYVINLGAINWGGCRQGSNKCNIKISKSIFANFAPFNGQKETLIAQGVRILAPPDPNNPKLEVSDLLNIQEGEITISGNSQTAWVPLGHNNAIAEFDLRKPRAMNILGLGFKDHNIDGNGLDASDRDKRINQDLRKSDSGSGLIS
ncbi:MAG TPA: hypothetical protein VES89_01280 [Candidatus Competibacteraceae bacterium]|nr:hypothetical protein [Candidatus Competibacteraceae bacterium]